MTELGARSVRSQRKTTYRGVGPLKDKVLKLREPEEQWGKVQHESLSKVP